MYSSHGGDGLNSEIFPHSFYGGFGNTQSFHISNVDFRLSFESMLQLRGLHLTDEYV
jgi:hypothetical protein